MNDSFYEYYGVEIPGYNANLMRARASFSSTEEKKLLHRINWYLIQLLVLITKLIVLILPMYVNCPKVYKQLFLNRITIY